jgi:hypothetical protein
MLPDIQDVTYGGTQLNPSSATRRLHFVYESRPDSYTYFVSGGGDAVTTRVSAIQVFAPAASGEALAWDYRFTYGQSPSSKRSLLREVTWCDFAGVCLQPTKFSWGRSEIEEAPLQPNDYDIVSLNDPTTATPTHLHWTKPLIGDLDGDGRDEVLYQDGDSSTNSRMFVLSPPSSGTPHFDEAPFIKTDVGAPFSRLGSPSLVWSKSRMADLDGDGRSELVGVEDYYGYQIWSWNADTRTFVAAADTTSDPAGQLLQTHFRQLHLLDLNGDCRLDIVKDRPLPSGFEWIYSLSAGSLNYGNWRSLPQSKAAGKFWTPTAMDGLSS